MVSEAPAGVRDSSMIKRSVNLSGVASTSKLGCCRSLCGLLEAS